MEKMQSDRFQAADAALEGARKRDRIIACVLTPRDLAMREDSIHATKVDNGRANNQALLSKAQFIADFERIVQSESTTCLKYGSDAREYHDAVGAYHVELEDGSIGIVSAIDGTDKYSEEYADCIGVVACGRRDGESQSLLAHVNPAFMLSMNYEPTIVDDPKREGFLNELVSRLNRLRDSSDEGTFDIGLFGGASNGIIYSCFVDGKVLSYTDVYCDAIARLDKYLCTRVEGLESIDVLVGPSTSVGEKFQYTHVVVDTGRRALFVVKPKQDADSHISFPASSVHEVRKQWG